MTLVTTSLPPPGLGEFLDVSATSSFVLPVAAAALAVAYLAAAVSLWARGRRWSIPRTVSFVVGCVLTAATTGLSVEDYSQVMLSVFMFEQLTLMMLVPPLLVLGSPVRLMLRSLPHRGAGKFVLFATLTLLRGRTTRWLLNPVLSVVVFLLLFYGLYLGDLVDPILGMPGGHLSLEVIFLLAGILFAIPILSDDPLPIRMTYPARALDLSAEVALHAFFGVFLMISPTLITDQFANPPASLGVDPLADQGVAGGLAWSYGEGPTVLILLYILHRWFRDDTKRAAAADVRADQFGDPDLDAYNEYLARLRELSQQRDGSQGDASEPRVSESELPPASERGTS